MFNYHFDEKKRRVTAFVEDGKEAGKVIFKPYKGYWSIDHTFVFPEYRGKGIAEKMTRELLAQARAAGVKVKPVCKFAVSFLDGNEEYADLIWRDPAEV